MVWNIANPIIISNVTNSSRVPPSEVQSLFWFLGIELVSLLVVTFLLLHYYSSKANHKLYTSVVFLSWFLGFGSILLLPLDVTQLYSGVHNVSYDTLLLLWGFGRTFYSIEKERKSPYHCSFSLLGNIHFELDYLPSSSGADKLVTNINF